MKTKRLYFLVPSEVSYCCFHYHHKIFILKKWFQPKLIRAVHSKYKSIHIFAGNNDAVEMLLANGARNFPMQSVYQNSTPLITASEYGNWNCFSASEYILVNLSNRKFIIHPYFIFHLNIDINNRVRRSRKNTDWTWK